MVRALRDPDGANLDRIQIIKGWADKEGKTHEKVYEVVWSDNRKLDAKGKLPRSATRSILKRRSTPTASGMPC